jgi:hypothetical protein
MTPTEPPMLVTLCGSGSALSLSTMLVRNAQRVHAVPVLPHSHLSDRSASPLPRCLLAHFLPALSTRPPCPSPAPVQSPTPHSDTPTLNFPDKHPASPILASQLAAHARARPSPISCWPNRLIRAHSPLSFVDRNHLTRPRRAAQHRHSPWNRHSSASSPPPSSSGSSSSSSSSSTAAPASSKTARRRPAPAPASPAPPSRPPPPPPAAALSARATTSARVPKTLSRPPTTLPSL